MTRWQKWKRLEGVAESCGLRTYALPSRLLYHANLDDTECSSGMLIDHAPGVGSNNHYGGSPADTAGPRNSNPTGRELTQSLPGPHFPGQDADIGGDLVGHCGWSDGLSGAGSFIVGAALGWAVLWVLTVRRLLARHDPGSPGGLSLIHI